MATKKRRKRLPLAGTVIWSRVPDAMAEELDDYAQENQWCRSTAVRTLIAEALAVHNRARAPKVG
jgi:metal-responsive CopG/Arc/MetJ family transcriptional regulator